MLIKERQGFLDAGRECRAISASNAGTSVGRNPVRVQRSVEKALIVPPTAVTPRTNVHRRPISTNVAVIKPYVNIYTLYINDFTYIRVWKIYCLFPFDVFTTAVC